MATNIIDTIKAKNGNFPVAESNDIKGGPFYKETIAERDSINPDFLTEGCLCYVKQEQTTYKYMSDNSWLPFSAMLLYVDNMEERNNLTNVTSGQIVVVKDIGDNQGEGVYLYTKNENEDAIWFKINSTDLTSPTLSLVNSKINVNKGDVVTVKLNYQSNAPGSYTIKVNSEGYNKTFENRTKGEFTLNLNTVSEEKTYVYTISAENIYGMQSNVLTYTVVCGGLKFIETFTNYVDNNILGENKDISFEYQSYSSDNAVTTVYNKFILDKYENNVLTNVNTSIISNENNSTKRTYTLPSNLSAGTYHFSVYTASDENFIDSMQWIDKDFILLKDNSFDALINVRNIDNLNTNTNIYLDYKVIYYNSQFAQNNLYIKLKVFKNGTTDNLLTDRVVAINNNIENNYFIGKLKEAADYTYRLYVSTSVNVADSSKYFEGSFNVAEYTNQDIDSYTSENLLLYFDANDRSSSDKDYWIPAVASSEFSGYKIKLNNLSNNYLLNNLNDSTSGITVDNVNGWVNEVELVNGKYQELTDENTNPYSMLKFTGDSYGVLIDDNNDYINPFNKAERMLSPKPNFVSDNTSIIENKGFSFECYFRTRFTGEDNAKVVTTMTNNALQTGFSFGYNDVILYSDQSTELGFSEDTWNHIVVTFDYSTREVGASLTNEGLQDAIEVCNPYPTMRIYLNGALSSIEALSADAMFLSSESKLPFTINAYPFLSSGNVTFNGFGECEIKVMRFYKAALTPKQVISNYYSVLKTDEKNEQKALNNDTNESNLRIPIVRFQRLNITTTKDPDYVSDFKSLNQITEKKVSKTNYVPCKTIFEYMDENGKLATIEQNAQVYLQGTSSLAYPVKNYKIKYGDFKSAGSKVDYGETDEFKKVSVNFNSTGIVSGWAKEKTITLKCDYMEASHLNNTPTAKFFNERVLPAVLSNKLGSPAYQNGYKDGIDGFPVLLYYYDELSLDPNTHVYTYSNETYAGTFMFNIDKSGNTLGFEPYSDEQLQNDPTLTNKCLSFECASNKDEYSAGAFYSYIETAESILNEQSSIDTTHQTEPKLSTKEEYYTWKEGKTSKQIEDKLAELVTITERDSNGEITSTYKYTPLKHVTQSFELRYDYDEDATEASEDIENIKFGYLNDAITYIADAYNNNSYNKDEFAKHFDTNYALTYFLQMMMFGQVDNAGKNSMWDTWLTRIITENEDGSIVYYDRDHKPLYKTTITENEQSIDVFKYTNTTDVNNDYLVSGKDYINEDYMEYNAKFYIRPYDMDTQAGLNNTGHDVIGVDAELNKSLQPTNVHIDERIYTTTEVGDISTVIDGRYPYWHFYRNDTPMKEDDDETTKNTYAQNARFHSYNTNGSKFWNLFAKAFDKDIKSQYSSLRNSGVYDENNIMNFYSDITGDIGNKFFNKDMASKFLNITTKNSSGDTVYNKTYLYACNGNRRDRFRSWISQRIIFLDSYYGYYDDKGETEGISFRINCSLNDNSYIAIQTYSPQYIRIKIGNQDSDPEYKIYTSNDYYYRESGGIKSYGTQIKLPNINFTDKEVFIYGTKNIKKIDNFKTLGPSSLSIANLSKITNLDLSGLTDSKFTEITLPNTDKLRYLYLNSCVNLAGSIDLSNARNLRVLNVSNTKLTGISLPVTGALNIINVSNTNVKSLIIKNLMNLSEDGLNINDCTNLENISIINCNLTKFDLSGDNINVISSDSIEIADCSNLEYINLQKLNVKAKRALTNGQPTGGLHITNNDKLKTFKMFNNSSVGLDVLDLSSNVNLSYIDLFQDINLETLILPTNENGINNILKILRVCGCSKLKYLRDNLQNIDIDYIDLSPYKNLSLTYSNLHKNGFFQDCTSMEYVKINNVDNVYDKDIYLASFFYNCTSFKGFIAGSKLSVYSCANLYTNDVQNSSKLNDSSISDLDKLGIGSLVKTTANTSASNMFYKCYMLDAAKEDGTINKIKDNIELNLYGITNISSMFTYDYKVLFSDVEYICNSTINSGTSSVTTAANLCSEGAGRDRKDTTKNEELCNIYLPVNIFKGFKNVTSLTSAFYGCSSIQCINVDVFAPLRNLGSSALAIDFTQIFCACSGLKNIYSSNGTSLFTNIKTSNLSRVFWDDTNLIGLFSATSSVQPLFNSTNSDCTSIKLMFGNCPNLTLDNKTLSNGILAYTYDNSNKLSVISNSNTYYNMLDLTKTELIDNNEFSTFLQPLTNLQWANYVFVNCAKIQCAVPNGLFRCNTNLKSISGFFAKSGINHLGKEISLFNNSADTTYPNLIYARSLFTGCTNFDSDSFVGDLLFTNVAGTGGAINLQYISENAGSLGDDGYSDRGGHLINGYYGMFSNTNLQNFNYNVFKQLKKLKSTAYLFYVDNVSNRTLNVYTDNNATSLMNSVLSDMFYIKNSEITDMKYMYYGNYLNGALNSEIRDTNARFSFSDFPKVATANNCFMNTTFNADTHNITGLFDNCTYLNNINYMFRNSNISVTLPDNNAWFNNTSTNSQQLSMQGLFMNSKLKGNIPIKLFNNVRRYIINTSLMFYNCKFLGTNGSTLNDITDNKLPTGSTGDNITVNVSYSDGEKYVTVTSNPFEVQGLLGGCVKLNTVSGMFSGCYRIKGGIPDDLFWLPIEVTYNSASGDEQTISYSEKYSTSDISYLFEYCLSMDQPYVDNEINYICNASLFNNLINVTNANGVFAFMAKIGGAPGADIYIPSGIFTNMTKLKSASYAFASNNQYTTSSSNADFENVILPSSSENLWNDNYTRYTANELVLGSSSSLGSLFNTTALGTTLQDIKYMFLKCKVTSMSKYFLFAIDSVSDGENATNKVLKDANHIFFRVAYSNPNGNNDINLPLINNMSKFTNMNSDGYNKAYYAGSTIVPNNYSDFIGTTLTNTNTGEEDYARRLLNY